ncbi:aminotransferase class I/II-fold pyridoxal phosphate-dependent enzyme [Nocardioides marmoriginsengisoli]|uniref:Aromatic amino acid aminotransferase n=1 Tax=Nocardioides marmoriginsengisoli TaxID=661483 RepID=A0A3N0CAM1_9ACTN|nr:histidinol-phosphate transaminase [Nocardioides marmoriginsengisoli]RNL60518.1 aminotransferase class I/II-fold pyridoxal phosphate-dependent enzyme [Nocardioides marmoriginsengisoli]
MTALTPQPRAALADIPAYVPGKPPTPRPGVATYKLSSNENPYPPLAGVLDAVAEAARSLNRYPDMGNAALRAGLAADLGVGPDQLAPGTGSVAVLYHLLAAYCDPGDEVVHAWRSFEAYPIGIAVAGATSVPVPVTATGAHDLAAMAAAVTERTKVVLLCTPNNPTGPALSHAEVAAFVAQVPGHVIVVLDEAYREFVRIADPVRSLDLVAAHPNVVAMRTFAKAYGLAGLRVGYLAGAEPIAAAVRACSLPFGVSSIAQAATLASLAAKAELLDRVELIVAERSRVVDELAGQGWSLPDAQGNFVWFDLGTRTAAFAAAAEKAGIVVRPFADEGVRVTIGEPAANDVLLRLAAGWVD